MLTLPQTTVLGPLEDAVMRIIWAHAAPITVRAVYEVYEALDADHDGAYTTIMTTMVRLAEKGVLTRAPVKLGAPGGRGSAYHYTTAVSRAELLRSAVEQLLTSFGANAAERQHLAAAVQQGSQGAW
jgi:predicted transcriptional regulator